MPYEFTDAGNSRLDRGPFFKVENRSHKSIGIVNSSVSINIVADYACCPFLKNIKVSLQKFQQRTGLQVSELIHLAISGPLCK